MSFAASSRAGNDRADAAADPRLEPAAHPGRRVHVAARRFLDHPLDRRDREGDAAGLDRLQVERREQGRMVGERGCGKERAPLDRGGIVELEQVGDCRRGGGDVLDHAAADEHRRRSLAEVEAPRKHRLIGVGGQHLPP